MTHEDLKKHSLFSMCSVQEQLFLLTYLSTRGDISKSISVAFPSVQNIQRKAILLQKNETISALLAFIDGEDIPTAEAIRKLVWKTMRNSTNEYIVMKGAELLTQNTKPTEEELRHKRLEEARRIDGIKLYEARGNE